MFRDGHITMVCALSLIDFNLSSVSYSAFTIYESWSQSVPSSVLHVSSSLLRWCEVVRYVSLSDVDSRSARHLIFEPRLLPIQAELFAKHSDRIYH
jgi:hypothetical protein